VPLLKPINPTISSDAYDTNSSYHYRNHPTVSHNMQERTLRLAEQGVPIADISKQLLIPEARVFKTICK